MLNMLIAMMAKSFDNIREASAMNYVFLFSQMTHAIWEQPPAPPPLYLLTLPSDLLAGVRYVCKQRRRKAAADYLPLAEPAAPAAAEVAVADGTGTPLAEPPARSDGPAINPAMLDENLAQAVRAFIIMHLNDTAHEERWRTQMMKKSSERHYVVEGKLLQQQQAIGAVEARLERMEGTLAAMAAAMGVALAASSAGAPREEDPQAC